MLTFHQSVPFCPKIVLADALGYIKTGTLTIEVGETKFLGIRSVGFLFINGMGSFNQIAQIVVPNNGNITVVSSSNSAVFGSTSEYIVQVNGNISEELSITNNWTQAFTIRYMMF